MHTCTSLYLLIHMFLCNVHPFVLGCVNLDTCIPFIEQLFFVCVCVFRSFSYQFVFCIFYLPAYIHSPHYSFIGLSIMPCNLWLTTKIFHMSTSSKNIVGFPFWAAVCLLENKQTNKQTNKQDFDAHTSIQLTASSQTNIYTQAFYLFTLKFPYLTSIIHIDFCLCYRGLLVILSIYLSIYLSTFCPKHSDELGYGG